MVIASSPQGTVPSIYSSVPVDYRKKEIRLVKIHPGGNTDPIRMNVIKVGLATTPRYNALSYAWGGSEIDAIIHMDQHNVKVTGTLHQALIQLRDASKETVYWIDALCIDQSSTAEKNHQVPMMGEIYSSAQRVVIWLGDETRTLEPAIDLLKFVEANRAEEDALEVSRVHEYLDQIMTSSTDSRDALNTALIELMEQRWFSRTWVLQEAVLSSADPLIMCGAHRISWFSLCLVDWCLATYLVLDPLHTQRNDPTQLLLAQEVLGHHNRWEFKHIRWLRETLQDIRPCGLSIELALENSRSASASVPRDRIYGLLGMVCHGHNVKLKVDYAKLTSEVFQETMESILLQNQSLSFLAFKEEEAFGFYPGDSQSFKSSSIPDSRSSWIPDFGRCLAAGARGRISRKPKQFRADGGVAPVLRTKASSLFARGVSLDCISYTKNVNEASTELDSYWSPLVPLFELLWNHARVPSHQSQQRKDGCGHCMAPNSWWETIILLLDRLCGHSSNTCLKHNGSDEATPMNHDESNEQVCHCASHGNLNGEASVQKLNGLKANLKVSNEMSRPPRFDRCGLYHPLNGPECDFWEAAWKSLIAENSALHDTDSITSQDEDLIRFAIHWEKAVIELESSGTSDSPPALPVNSRPLDPNQPRKIAVEQALQDLQRSMPFKKAAHDISHKNAHILTRRQVFVTKNGWMGLGPQSAQSGDMVVVLFGSKVPYVLRPVEDHFQFLGECYLHSIMNGELVAKYQQSPMEGPFAERDFEIH